jgi:hypothetical protein
MLLRPSAIDRGIRSDKYSKLFLDSQKCNLEVSILEQAPNGTIFKLFNAATIQSDAIPEVEFIYFVLSEFANLDLGVERRNDGLAVSCAR